MNPSTRILINTLSQYIRTIVSAIITLYTTRVILLNLGISDYGINDIVGGIIAMFSFVNLTLSTTTQRYLSYNQGKEDYATGNKVFNNSFIIQLVGAISISLVMFICTDFLFSSMLNIEADRLEAAKFVYYCMIISFFLNFMVIPYQALLIAHENIVFSSLVLIVESFIKIPVALSLAWVSFDKLEWYALCNLGIVVFDLSAYYIYCTKKYTECKRIILSQFDIKLFKEMFSFAGWTLYGSACVIGRSKGIAMLINNFFSTAVNGAMGIGGQVSTQLSFLSASLTNSMRPQIIKAEGAGNRERMIRLTEICCKASIVLLSLITIPAVFEMQDLMGLWLVEVPDYAVFFAQAFLISAWVDQSTVGLSIANAASGNVKYFQVITNTIKLLALPTAYIFLKQGYMVEITMYIYIVFEILCSCIRLYMLKVSIRLSIQKYLSNVIVPLIIPIFVTGMLCYKLSDILTGILCFSNFVISAFVFLVFLLLFGLKNDEKQMLYGLYNKARRIIK